MTNSLAPSPAAAMGGLLAVATIPLHFLLSKTQSEQIAAVLAAVIGAIYIGFSLQKGDRVQIVTELTVVTEFFAAALAGIWVTPWILPVALAAHGIWDYARHRGLMLASIPSKLVAMPLGHPPFCAVADWVAAASLAVEPACLNA
ncbi:MAG: hypothetical protein WBG11_06630 [Methylocella sp.]